MPAATASSWAKARPCSCSRTPTRPRGAARRPYAELLGYGATSDAYHMVQPRADGREAARAASIALDDAGVDPDAIDYVNAHASSTPIGDVAEARAIALALGERAATVPVSGTKALYGHPLGASGAIEAAICALAIRDGWAPASVNLGDADPEVGRAPARACCATAGTATYRRVLSTSFGFGGLNAALVFGAAGLSASTRSRPTGAPASPARDARRQSRAGEPPSRARRIRRHQTNAPRPDGERQEPAERDRHRDAEPRTRGPRPAGRRSGPRRRRPSCRRS